MTVNCTEDTPNAKNVAVTWPAHSLGVNLYDIYLLVYLKSRVYISKPNNNYMLRRNIQAEFKKIYRETCRNVIRNVSENANRKMDVF